MAEKEETTQHEQTNKSSSAFQNDLPPRPKRFWANPWFILGVIIFALSVTFTLMNNSEITINFIGASMIIKLPILILGSALLGAAIEFFVVLGPRSDSKDEIRRLKQHIRELTR